MALPSRGFLSQQGVSGGEVCVSRMIVTPSERGKGLAHALKAAQVAASETYSEAIKAVVRRAGGAVSEGSVCAWTLVKVRPESRKDR